MQTEFTCGIYTATFIIKEYGWRVTANDKTVGSIDTDGCLFSFSIGQSKGLSPDMLIELAVLMNNIKRQYKQLQTT